MKPQRTTATIMLANIRAKDRATEKLNRHRWAVITLAIQSAIKEIKREFRAQGVRLSEVSNKDIHIWPMHTLTFIALGLWLRRRTPLLRGQGLHVGDARPLNKIRVLLRVATCNASKIEGNQPND